jgi:lysine biosynthesis protein LysW
MAERTSIKKIVVDCVDCGEPTTLSGRIEIGQIVTCPECYATMEVISLDPVQVDWVRDEPVYTDQEEDW